MGAACVGSWNLIALTHERQVASTCPPKCQSNEDWRQRNQFFGNVPRRKDVCSKSKQLLFLFFLLLFSVVSIWFHLLTPMSSLPTSNVSLSSLAQYPQDVPDGEQSSDNESVSNSDAEPQMQDSKVEMQEGNISETVANVVLENQEFGRNWQRIGPSKDTAIVSRQCISINKYNFIIRVIIICSYMLLHVPIRAGVSVTVLVQYQWGPRSRVTITQC